MQFLRKILRYLLLHATVCIAFCSASKSTVPRKGIHRGGVVLDRDMLQRYNNKEWKINRDVWKFIHYSGGDFTYVTLCQSDVPSGRLLQHIFVCPEKIIPGRYRTYTDLLRVEGSKVYCCGTRKKRCCDKNTFESESSTKTKTTTSTTTTTAATTTTTTNSGTTSTTTVSTAATTTAMATIPLHGMKRGGTISGRKLDFLIRHKAFDVDNNVKHVLKLVKGNLVYLTLCQTLDKTHRKWRYFLCPQHLKAGQFKTFNDLLATKGALVFCCGSSVSLHCCDSETFYSQSASTTASTPTFTISKPTATTGTPTTTTSTSTSTTSTPTSTTSTPTSTTSTPTSMTSTPTSTTRKSASTAASTSSGPKLTMPEVVDVISGVELPELNKTQTPLFAAVNATVAAIAHLGLSSTEDAPGAKAGSLEWKDVEKYRKNNTYHGREWLQHGHKSKQPHSKSSEPTEPTDVDKKIKKPLDQRPFGLVEILTAILCCIGVLFVLGLVCCYAIGACCLKDGKKKVGSKTPAGIHRSSPSSHPTKPVLLSMSQQQRQHQPQYPPQHQTQYPPQHETQYPPQHQTQYPPQHQPQYQPQYQHQDQQQYQPQYSHTGFQMLNSEPLSRYPQPTDAMPTPTVAAAQPLYPQPTDAMPTPTSAATSPQHPPASDVMPTPGIPTAQSKGPVNDETPTPGQSGSANN